VQELNLEAKLYEETQQNFQLDKAVGTPSSLQIVYLAGRNFMPLAVHQLDVHNLYHELLYANKILPFFVFS